MKQYVEVDFRGTLLRISANYPDDHIVRHLASTGQVYEAELLFLLQRLGGELQGDAALDVGAHVGNHTAVLAGALGYRTIAVEPGEELFAELERTVALNDLSELVTSVHAAAWSTSGRHSLTYIPGSAENRGLGRVDEEEEDSASSRAVDAVTLDDLVPASTDVAIIKVDTEGTEPEVLRGAKRTLDRCRPVVVVETQRHEDAEAIQELLPEHELVGVFGPTPVSVFVPKSSSPRVLAMASGWSHLQRANVQGRLDAWRQRTELRIEGIDSGREELRRLVEVVAEHSASRHHALKSSLTESVERLESLQREIELRAEQVEEQLSRLLKATASTRAASPGPDDPQRKDSTPGGVMRSTEAAMLEDLRIIRQLDGATSLRVARLVRQAQAQGPRGWLRLPKLLLDARRDGGVGTEFTRYQGAYGRSQGRDDEGSIARSLVAPIGSEASRTRIDIEATPLVSVIVTAFQAEDHVGATIESLRQQTYGNLEIIVVDDASTDRTSELLSDLASVDERIRYLRVLENRGTYFCKNLGLSQARGRYVTFNDADDRSDATRIEKQLAAIQSNESLRLVACDYQRVDEAGRTILNRGLLSRLSLQSLLFDRLLLDELGFFDSVRVSADAEFFARFTARFGRRSWCHLREPLYFALLRQDALTASEGQRASLGDGSASEARKPLESFLSENRTEYLRSFSHWHEKEFSPTIEFPLRRRPFEAPEAHVERTLSPAPVIAGMATIGRRRESLPLVLASLSSQVDELHVHLNDYDTPPIDNFRGNIRYTTHHDFGNLGDNAKFLPVFQSNSDAYFFTVDDDIIYPEDYVRRMQIAVDSLARSAAIGVHVARLPPKIRTFYGDRNVAHFRRGLDRFYGVDLIGTGTLAWFGGAPSLSAVDFGEPGMADLWFALACRSAGVPRIALPRQEGWLQELPQEDSIWQAGQKDDSVQTRIARMHEPWGSSVIERELLAWHPALGSNSIRAGLGFSDVRLDLPERSW